MSSVKIQGSPTGTANFTIAVPDGTSTDRTIELPDAAGSFVLADGSNNVTVSGDLTVDTDTLHVDSTNNRVGIGTASPSATLESLGGQLRIGASTAGSMFLVNPSTTYSDGVDLQATYNGAGSYGPLKFSTAGTERARINSSGSLLVGKTTTDVGTQGARIDNTGRGFFTRSGSFCAQLNRLSSDGDIIDLRKDGSSVGSIASGSGRLAIGDGPASLRFVDASQKRISPFNITSLSDYDALIDLGESGSRFQDIFATNGTIQTSDANEKQQIALLTDDEITAAKAISKLFKTFKWNSAVEAKGDAARTHTGVIAQEVQQAMTDAGLDAGNYAFFIRGVWWETQTEVPAVEAVDEVVDEDGNVVTEAVEAQEAYTRTDTYDTLEEAPAGAVERTRLGVRYPELLAFIGAATEQRLASIEARLDALEAV